MFRRGTFHKSHMNLQILNLSDKAEGEYRLQIDGHQPWVSLTSKELQRMKIAAPKHSTQVETLSELQIWMDYDLN